MSRDWRRVGHAQHRAERARSCARSGATTPSRAASSSSPPRSGSGSTRAAATLPPERELAERMGVSRATLREAIAALRAAGFVSTTRGRGGGTVVSYRPREAVGPRRPGAGAAQRAAARHAGLPPGRRAGCLPHRGRARPERGPSSASCWSPRSTRWRRDRPGRAPAGRLALPPRDRRGHRVAADGAVGRRRCRPTCTTCSTRSRCSRSTSTTRAGSTGRSSARSSRRARQGPPGHGEPLRRHRRAAARPAGLTVADHHDWRIR